VKGAGQKRLDPWFIDRAFTSPEHFQLRLVLVHANNVVPHVCEHNTGNQADIAGSHDCNLHAQRIAQQVTQMSGGA